MIGCTALAVPGLICEVRVIARVPAAKFAEAVEEIQQLAGRVRFVGLNVQDSASSAAEFANDVGVTYEILLDPSGTAPGKLGATAMPSTIVVDADGTVAAIYVGKLDADGLRALLDEVLV